MVVRLFTGSDGQTHAEEVALSLATNASLSEQSRLESASGVQFWRTSPGFVNDWHPASRRQYIIRVSGQLEVELAAGKKLSFGPGRIVLAEDLTGMGHITRCIGADDCVSVMVPLAP
jgi:hypothetical protein